MSFFFFFFTQTSRNEDKTMYTMKLRAKQCLCFPNDRNEKCGKVICDISIYSQTTPYIWSSVQVNADCQTEKIDARTGS